jgi:hypothetical protein
VLRRPSPAALYLGLAIIVTVYGGLLRLDAFTQKYGTLQYPLWARVLTNDVAPLMPAATRSTISGTAAR